ncbi:MAG: serine hydrolase, partial [Bacteroidales bacterium]|nr:serine hydrolase [Bacteroidales bacterium]
TLSPKIVTDLLKTQMGFDGLVVTDALDMKGVTKYFPSGEIEVKALLAGNDILLLPKDVPAAINGLIKALESGRISQNLLKTQCKKILSYKYDLGLNNYQAIEKEHLIHDLQSPKGYAIKEKLFENAITLIQNKDHVLPLKKQTKNSLAIVSFGLKKQGTFEKYASKYSHATYIYLSKSLSIKQNDSISNLLNNFEYVIFNIGKTSIFPQKSFGITASEIELINTIAPKTKTIINLLGSPLAAEKYFKQTDKYHAFIVSHQANKMTQKLSAEMIFGALPFKGNIPVKISDDIPSGFGIHTKSLGLIKYGKAENVDIDGDRLEKEIDSIVKVGIEMKAFPGCQISISKGGYIIFEKNYGYQTYDSIIKVKSNTIYDIASITKVAASIPSLMHYYDKKKIDLDTPLSKYIDYSDNTNKADLTLRNILTHQAQLTPWIPFYWYNMDSIGHLNPEVFQTHQDDVFSVRVAENIYIKEDYKYLIYDTIIKSDLRDKAEYKYSDLGYFFVPQIIENFSNLPINEFVKQQFYQKLNLKYTTYHPRQHFNLLDIAPTEKDTLFRKQTIRGDVHDPGAAMLGGVCGHAGLFSTAEDLTILFQMYLQKGYYGGYQYIDTTTIAEFTRYQFDGNKNRRALGFDKPYKKYDEFGPVCESASLDSYGHSGFTGTYVWADPKNQTVYVFLSNRVYPKADNYKISKFDFRTNIHQALYNAEK